VRKEKHNYFLWVKTRERREGRRATQFLLEFLLNLSPGKESVFRHHRRREGENKKNPNPAEKATVQARRKKKDLEEVCPNEFKYWNILGNQKIKNIN